MPRRSSGSENSGDYNWRRLWEMPSKKSQRRYAKAWVHPLLGDFLISKDSAIPKQPVVLSEFTTMTTNPANLTPEDQLLSWRQEIEARQEEQTRQMAELHEQANRLRKKMSACEPSWKPAGPSSRGNLPTHFHLLVSAKVKKSLCQTM